MNRMITRPAVWRALDVTLVIYSYRFFCHSMTACGMASITAGAAEDPLWVDYCRLPD
jgi:hypothetical protein